MTTCSGLAGRLRLAGRLVAAVVGGAVLSAGCDSSRAAAAGDGLRTSPSSSSAAPAAATATPPPVRAPRRGSIDYCTACGPPQASGVASDPRLEEASGLVASRLHPGVYYVHNDSGDEARFFAIGASGAVQGTFELRGATALDWEDVAIGPCPDGSCLYLADIGDNYEVRTDCALYRVAEPTKIGPGVRPVSFARLPFEYPDGSHNAETLLAHPTTGELVIVTKVAWGPSAAYRFPLPLTPGTSVTLVKIAELSPPAGTALLTGGDVHPDGHGLLLRTYTDLFYGPLRDGTLGSALLGPLCSVPVATETQGETVAWTAEGDGWITMSEGVGEPVYRTSCTPP